MAGHDQRLKELLREAFAWFLALILPGWPERYDLARTEWLQQEAALDPPQGERRVLDLVARLRRRQPAEDGTEEVLAHVEIEWGDRATRARRQLSDGYRVLRQRHNLPVLPLALYLQVALQGRGTDAHEERTDELEVYSLRFPYLGLPGLVAREHVEGDNLVGVALSGLMRMDEAARPWVKARAMQRVATAELSVYRRFLLMECIEAYSPLDGPHLAEFEHLLRTEDFREAAMIAKTSYEKGTEVGERNILRRLLERRFGPLPEAVRGRLDSWPEDRLLQLADELLTAASLAELGLDDGPNGASANGAHQA